MSLKSCKDKPEGTDTLNTFGFLGTIYSTKRSKSISCSIPNTLMNTATFLNNLRCLREQGQASAANKRKLGQANIVLRSLALKCT